MKRDLPSIFANEIKKDINNSQDIFYENRSIKKSSDSVRKKINDIFSSIDFVYKKDVEITIDNKTYIKTIIGTNNGYLLTLDNESIDINEINQIKKL